MATCQLVRTCTVALIAAMVASGCDASSGTTSPGPKAQTATATPDPPAAATATPETGTPGPAIPTLGSFDPKVVQDAFRDRLVVETVSPTEQKYELRDPNAWISFTTEGSSPAVLVSTTVRVPDITLDFSTQELADLIVWRDMMNLRAEGAPAWFSQQMSLYLGNGMVYGDGQEVQVQHDVGYQYLTFSLKYPDTQPGEPTPGFPHEMLLSIEGG